MLICPACSQPIDPSGPAVCGFCRDGEWRNWWAPFVEDLRTNPARMLHPKCYLEADGIDALLELIRASDELQRRSSFSDFKEIMKLRQQHS